MKKKISEMTLEEKKLGISDAERSCAYYEFGRGMAALLEEYVEMNDLQNDPQMSAAINKLHTLENKIVVLYDQYNINLTNEFLPLVKGYEQQIARMNQRHIEERSKLLITSNPALRFGVTKLTMAQEKEKAELLAQQAAEKEKIRKKLTHDLDKCKRKLSHTFINAVRYLYR